MLKKIILYLLILSSIATKGFSQVTCDFTYGNVADCVGFAGTFCDASESDAGDIVSWAWTIGTSSFSVECPSTLFNQAGTFTVCLTVTDIAGNMGTTCYEDLVQVFNLPTPDFVADVTSGCSPLEVTYTDLSQGIDGTIIEWNWALNGSCGTFDGDGSTEVATCVYTLAGSYNVNVVVTDDNGCVNTMNKIGYINVSPEPTLDISSALTFDCLPPFDVDFDNNNILPGVIYAWDFGNGETFIGPEPPLITYEESGSYSVTIIATDQGSSCADTLVLEDYVNVGYPADFSYDTSFGCEDLLVNFTDESDIAADSVLWSFADGGTSTAANPTYIFTEPGCYIVQLKRFVGACVTIVNSEFCILVEAEPDVSYTNDNLIGCELPHVVNFAGISVEAEEWLWDFGDGETSTEQSPTHTYTEFGEWEVTLTVTNSSGCTNDTTISVIDIRELEGILVNDNFDGCIPIDITLEENSNSITPITEWSWEVIGGLNSYVSTDENPTLTITDTGLYDVVLITMNTLGCRDTALFEGVIEVGEEPDVNFEAVPLETCIDVPVIFTDLTAGDVDEWFWDFGDGGTSIEQNPEYSYADTGYYDVSLIVQNNGCFSTITFDDYIHAIAPVAKFSVINFCEDNTLRQFVNTSVGADSTFWDFGVLGTDTDTSSLTNPEFNFPGPGTYTVLQWVFNEVTMCAHSTTREVVVTIPVADFSITPTEGCSPMIISVEDNSTDAISWQWSSANGNVSNPTGQNPTVSYNSPGFYENDITLIITDFNDCQDTFTLADPIYANAVSANLTSDVISGCAPLTVSFTDLSVNDYFAEVDSWSWDFGPGLGTSTAQNPEFTFDNLGLYDVVLTVTDTWGCTNTTTFTNYIDVTHPVASFVADTLSCTSHNMLFQSTSSGWQLDYDWDFGDGTTGTGAGPLHQFATEGTFTVCLTITDGYDCTDITCSDIFVADPIAAFSVDSTFAPCPPLPVNFTNLSINAISYLWDFGDIGTNNAPSDELNPSYVYTSPGTFDVQLVAFRSEACQDTLNFTDLIVLDGPEGEFTVSIDSTCVPAEITFVGNSIEPYLFVWDFNTGFIDTSEMPISYDSLTFVYNEIGSYNPTLGFINSTGCFRSLTAKDIYVAGLEADVDPSKRAVCNNDPGVSFTPIFNATEPVTNVEWIFENGMPGTSTETAPVSNFTVTGLHDVTLISETRFCLDTLVLEDYIGVGETPIADFVMISDGNCGPLFVEFMDMSSVSNGTIETWNWDFGDGTSSNLQNPTHTFQANDNISINLQVVTDVGCTDNHIENTFVHPQTVIDAGEDVLVCIGEPTQLHATINADTSSVQYSWSPAAGLSCTECLDPWVLNPTDTVEYTLEVISTEGCPNEAYVTVFTTPYEVPDIILSPDTTLCADQLTQIFVGIGNNAPIFTYQWDTSTPGLSCYDNCFNPVASPEVNSTYVVTVTTTEGCFSVDSIAIDVEDLFQPFTGDDKTICEGDSIELDASFGTNPEWLMSTGLTCASCPNPIATPDSTTTYIVSVITDMECQVIDTIVVNILSPDAVGAGEDFAICRGEIAFLDGFGPGQIIWTPDVTLNDPNILNPEGTPTVGTEYTMTAINGDCTFEDAIFVEVNDKTELEDNDFLICEGEQLTLGVEGFSDTYEWTPSEGLSDPLGKNPSAIPSETIEYTVIGALGLCEADTASVFVEVTPGPQYYLDEKRYYVDGRPLVLDVRLFENANLTYDWSPAIGLSCTDCQNPGVLPPFEDRVYTLTVTDEDTGCSKTRQVSVERLTSCSQDLVGVPNVFSPNDDDVNDKLDIIVSPTIDEIQQFMVYDRWGSLVYSSNSRYASWDGRMNGQDLQEGVYVYFVQFMCPIDRVLITKKGDITLVR